MKRHISIFAHLLCAFAAVGWIGVAKGGDQSVYGGYYYFGEEYKGADREKKYMTPLSAIVNDGDSVTFTAMSVKGMNFIRWGRCVGADSLSDIKCFDKVGWIMDSPEKLEWKGNSAEGNGALAVRFDYILFNVTFSTNGGTSEKPKDITDQNIDSTIPLPSVTRDGYLFAGWKNAKDKVFKSGNASGAAFWNDDDRKFYADLTAQWTTNKYTVTFDANGGDEPVPATKEVTYDSPYGELATCTRTGYTFNGWYTAASGGTKIEPSTVVRITKEQTLYAQWTAKTYDVILTLNGGHFPESDKPEKITVDVDKVFPVPAPERENWEFGGWTVIKTQGSSYAGAKWGIELNGATNDVEDADTVCKNGVLGAVYFMNLTFDPGIQVELKATWIRTIRATADPKDAGTVTGATTYRDGEPVTLTAIPNAGYAFCCWTNETGVVTNANLWTFTVEEDADFVAVFTGKVYQVVFKGEGGEPASQVVDETFGSKWKFPTKKPERTDYDFLNWTTQPAGAGDVLSKTDTITNIPPSVVYANWKRAENFTVMWIDLSGKITPVSKVVPADTPITQADADAATGDWSEKRDYNFWIKRWNPELPVTVTCSTNMTAVWESYSDVLDCTNLTFAVHKNWEVNTNKGFYAKGDSCLKLTAMGGNDHVTVTVTEPGELAFNWKTGATKTVLQLDKTEGGKKEGEQKHVDAIDKWTSVTVKVFVASEGKPAMIEFLPDPGAFEGYLALDAFTWTPGVPPPESHTVEVAADGPGAVSRKPERKTYVEGETVTLTAAADTGFAFCCWTNETGVVTNANPWTFTVTGDVRYWATFTNCPPVDIGYTVTVAGGEHGTARKSPDLAGYEEGSVVTLTAMPDPGYAFASWSDGSADASHDVTVTSNASYTATFTASVYTVTFDANGGELKGTATKSVTYGEPYGTFPEDPVKTGQLFAGWWTAKSGGIKVTPSTKVTSAKDHTLYAHWATGDMGELSKVLDCADLRFEEAVAGWTKYTGDWHNGDSCLRATASGAKVFARLSGSGTLIFWWRASGAKMQKATISVVAGNMTKICKAEAREETDWTKESIEIAADTEEISFVVTTPGAYCEIDDITWTSARPPEPESIVTNAVPVAVSGLVYTGGALTGVKEGDGYSIVGNVATNAGDYVATATPDGGTVWEGGSSAPTNIAWSIAKAAYDMGGVTFASVTNVADGARKSIFVSSALPTGVTVAYEGNGRSEPGEYTVTAKFTGDAANYEAIPDKTATLTILEPPEPVVTNAVPTAIADLVYDGTAKTGVAAGANYTIVGNVATNAGDYTATATVTNGVWEGGAKGATNIAWTIAKATVDMSGVTFASAAYVFDGKEHSIAVTGVPVGVEVFYTGDATNRTEVGTNTVTASFKVLDEVNYNAIMKQLTATLAITAKEEPPTPPEPVVTNAVPTAIAGLVYDGTAKTGVAAGANYTIVGNVATNAGDYMATATVTNGVWEGGAKGATNVAWTIAKATYDMTGVTFTNGTYGADGTAKSIFVSGALPPGATVAYEGNGQTEPGSYTVTAKFTGDAANYEAIPDMTATLTIMPAGLVRFETPTLVTTGGSNLVVVIWGGVTGMVSSVQLQAVYNTASAADLDLKKAKVDGTVQPSFKFPYTLKWREGELGARVVEIPVVKNKTTESDEFLTLQLGSPKNVRISGTDGGTENGGVCTVTIRGPKGPATGKWYARAVANDAMRGSVSGSKLCKKGATVTFKASARAGSAFVGWKTNDVLVTTAASWSFKMPTHGVEAVGTFVPQGEDYLRLGEIVLPSQLKAGASVTLGLPMPESLSRATVKVTGLPSGLSYDSKRNAITGKPKKASSKAATVAITVTNLAGYRIVRKYQVQVVKTVTSTDPAKLVSESAPCGAVTVAVNDELWGKVTGMGVYAAGAKVTLKATASAGYVFTGWETNGVAAVSRKASWSFTMPAEAVVAKAIFRPIAEDYLEFARDFLPAELQLNVSTNVVVPAAESLSQPTVTISGLPSGLSYSSSSGSIGGKPKKTGAKTVTVTVSNLSGFKIVRKYKVTVVKGTPKAGFASLTSESKPYFALTAVPDDVLAGTTSGTGVRQEGTKVTVKATALAGYVFGGWYEGDDRLTQKASYSFTMPGREMKLVAGFVTKAEDAASVGATVGGLGFGAIGGERMTVETNVYCGIRVDWPVVASAASLPSVKVMGLPSGLSYKSGKILGVPTVVSKAGKPSTVKVAVTTAGKASKTFSIVLTVEDREPWARGTYTGPYVAEGLTNGTMTLTVAKNGKISGKIVRKVSGKTKTTTLSATSIASRVQDNDGVFYGLEPSYKSGTKAIKMPFVLQLDPGGSGLGIAASEEVTLCQRE